MLFQEFFWFFFDQVNLKILHQPNRNYKYGNKQLPVVSNFNLTLLRVKSLAFDTHSFICYLHDFVLIMIMKKAKFVQCMWFNSFSFWTFYFQRNKRIIFLLYKKKQKLRIYVGSAESRQQIYTQTSKAIRPFSISSWLLD